MFEKGQLGQFLVKRFGGTLGHVYPRADSEFMIGFPLEKLVPGIQAILEAVRAFFESQGFAFDLVRVGHNSLTAVVRLREIKRNDPNDDQSVSIVITTNYPLTVGEGRTHVRVTTTIIR